MVKNYFFVLCALIGVGTAPCLYGQEIKIFTLKDFDLTGKVKSCTVITDYGKEEFDFDEEGYLSKLVTRYNDNDYDVTYYKYKNTDLLEKRLETYRDGAFQKETSIANLYRIDTSANKKKITESVLSYNKEFLEQYEYTYDDENNLIKIIRINNDGIDETRIERSHYKGETTKTYFLNEVIQKSERTSIKKDKNGVEQRIVLAKEFLEGKPTKASEMVYGPDEKLISEEKFLYDEAAKKFVSQEITNNKYNDLGMLSEITIKKGNSTEVKEYIYQYDGDNGNWIKKIITPDNTYTTRKIKYYPSETKEE